MRGNEIRATYRVVTPMFLAGADQSKAELRLPSIKGALRFWWRALAYSRLKGDLEKIAAEEALLFGSTSRQGAVLMRLEYDRTELKEIQPNQMLQTQLKDSGSNPPKVVGQGARYLAYGVAETFSRKPSDSNPKGLKEGQISRAYFDYNFKFTLVCRFKSGTPIELINTFLNSIKALGFLGGIGSKSRKGYGSVTLIEIFVGKECQKIRVQNRKALAAEITTLYSAFSSASSEISNNLQLPAYTAFSTEAKIYYLEAIKYKDNDFQNPLELLNEIGEEMILYRSWGRKGALSLIDNRGKKTPSEQNFKDDHDLMKRSPEQRTSHPRRISFGLPHNYGKSKSDQVNGATLERRASPLFIHIHQAHIDDPPIAVLAFLPARFLPPSEKVSVGGQEIALNSRRDFWKPIIEFCNRFSGREE